MSSPAPFILPLLRPVLPSPPPHTHPARKLAQLRQVERASLIAALTRYPLAVSGSEGYKKAEVTGGGLPLEQINCATMESRVRLWQPDPEFDLPLDSLCRLTA